MVRTLPQHKQSCRRCQPFRPFLVWGKACRADQSKLGAAQASPQHKRGEAGQAMISPRLLLEEKVRLQFFSVVSENSVMSFPMFILNFKRKPNCFFLTGALLLLQVAVCWDLLVYHVTIAAPYRRGIDPRLAVYARSWDGHYTTTRRDRLSGNRIASGYHEYAYVKYTYIYTLVCYFFDLMIYHLCLCVPPCGVGNKLRVSCKEIRFYFCTQLGKFCFVFVFYFLKTKLFAKQTFGTHTWTHRQILFLTKFTFKGRTEG